MSAGRVLGVAFAVLLMLACAPAPAARAEPVFEASSYPATVTGFAEKGVEVFTTEGGKVECDNAFDGVLMPGSILELHSVHTNCVAFGLLEPTINTEGCNFRYLLTEKVAVDSYKADVDLVCPPAQSIKIMALTCTVEVKAQTGLTAVDFAVTRGGGASDLTLNPTVTGIVYVVTKDGFLCPFDETGFKNDGTYTAETPLTLKAAEGESLSLSGE
jgi:hypothetical protein